MSYQQPLNTNKASATAAAKYVSNYTPQPHTDKTTTSSVYNSYNELTTNSRKNSPASASLPPICSGSVNRNQSSVDSKPSNVSRVLESTFSKSRDNTNATKVFSTRSKTLDQEDFEK